MKAPDNPFVDYNFSIILESEESHAYEKKPTLKSKLLFMDFHFNNLGISNLSILDKSKRNPEWKTMTKSIIKFGREGYEVNDIQVPGGTSISRRHCVIINVKNDVWIYDLESTGIWLNGEKIKHKAPIIGLNTLQIGEIEYIINTDNTKLL